jgi:hypothetical protein
LSAAAVETIKRYPLPENQSEGRKFSSFLMVVPDPRRKLVGTLRNLACPEVVYCGASDTNVWDERQKALAKYDDVVAGIITEARKRKQKRGTQDEKTNNIDQDDPGADRLRA